MAIRTQGTQLFYVSGPTVVTEVAQITGLSGLGGARDQIDTTVLTSLEREFLAGFASPDALTVDLVFNPLAASHVALQGLFASGALVPWMIGLSDAATTPTAVASAFVALTSRTNFRMTGYVADLSLDFSSNEVVRATVTIQRSGPFTLTVRV